MAIKHEEWKKILNAVNDDKDLNKDNVVEKIKGKLKAEGKGEYENILPYMMLLTKVI
ncbi:hypothetical protein [Wolbachia endosymbiont (group B) of Limnophora tigrina]|uniref:hypothetical protein n=1 Tax=Wolbachia endosymbiont (group B) of Limnophora tigrina TaxID=3139317 RepID=UPI0035B520E5